MSVMNDMCEEVDRLKDRIEQLEAAARMALEAFDAGMGIYLSGDAITALREVLKEEGK